MSLNDLELIECAIRAKRELLKAVDMAKAGELEGVRQAWEDIQAIALKAGYRCNDLRFNRK